MTDVILEQKYKHDDIIAKESFAENLIGNPNWSDYKWQQKHALKNVGDLIKFFPGLDAERIQRISKNTQHRKLMITPYTASLIQLDKDNGKSIENDPIWKQLVPEWGATEPNYIEYDGSTENWELEHEMVTPICQWKYTNRVIIRCANTCSSYCQFCYEALRVLETKTKKGRFERDIWKETVDFIRDHEEIEEVILSGGEPLILDDKLLKKMLADIAEIPRELCIRIHTRVLSFNPFRITDSLIQMLDRYGVLSVGLHVVHPNEITKDFKDAVRKLQGVVPIVFANIPLIGRVNNDPDTMKRLCMGLYRIGVIPHYLYHFMPFSPGVSEYRTSVREGIEILSKMKRHVSNMAVPEFVLPHPTGKFTVPLALNENQIPTWGSSGGKPVIRFSNWQGDMVEYSDYTGG